MSHSRLFGSILLILVSAASASAQVPKRVAYLTLELNARGDAYFDLFTKFDPRLLPDLANSIGQAMGCQFRDVAWNKDEDGYDLTASCDRAVQRRGLVIAGEINAAPIIEVLRNEDVTQLTVDVAPPDTAFQECSLATEGSAAVGSASEVTFH